MANNLDSMLSKGMGAVKGVKARLEGLKGVFTTLAQQHGEVSVLLDRVKANPDKRAELWPTIRKELISHERAEMREVYTELREHGPTSALADHHDAEADELDKLIQQIDATPLISTEWNRLFELLANKVVHHATEEETEIFPRAMATLGDEDAKRLDERFKATQKRIKETL